MDKIKEAGYPTVTPIIVTNTAEYEDIQVNRELNEVKHGESLLKVVKE